MHAGFTVILHCRMHTALTIVESDEKTSFHIGAKCSFPKEWDQGMNR